MGVCSRSLSRVIVCSAALAYRFMSWDIVCFADAAHRLVSWVLHGRVRDIGSCEISLSRGLSSTPRPRRIVLRARLLVAAMSYGLLGHGASSCVLRACVGVCEISLERDIVPCSGCSHGRLLDIPLKSCRLLGGHGASC